jgi:hypothetical protein
LLLIADNLKDALMRGVNCLLLYNYASQLHRTILAIMDVHIDLEEK